MTGTEVQNPQEKRGAEDETQRTRRVEEWAAIPWGIAILAGIVVTAILFMVRVWPQF